MEGPERHDQCMELSFFYATVESVLLYGSECWTLKPTLEKSLDGCYTRMLRAVLNINVANRIVCSQQNSLRGSAEGEREDCCKENETIRTLPKARRAVRQQTGAVGTDTWASLSRTSHTDIRGHTQEGCRSSKYQRTGRMYEES